MNKILKNNRSLFLFFAALSFLFYGNSILNGFGFDDSYVTVTNKPEKGQSFIPNNEFVAKGIRGIPKIWRVHYGHGNGTAYDYRPLVSTMFAIEYSLFGPSPHIDHAINVVLYALILYYVFILLRRCFREYSYGEYFALICTIIFAAHPIHSEVVNNIKCRDELLSLLFCLLSAVFIFKYYDEHKVKHIGVSALFMFLALSSKLTAAFFAGLIPLILFFFLKEKRKQAIFIFIGLSLCYFLFLKLKRILITEKAVRIFFHFENPLATEHISLYAKVIFALKTFGWYIKLLIFPYPLRFYYGSVFITTDTNLFNFEIILGLLFLAGSLYYCYRTRNKLALFGLLFFLLSIGPMTNIIKPVAGILGERFCFAPSIGFIVFVIAIIFPLLKLPKQLDYRTFFKKPLAYLTLVIGISLIYAWNRNKAWESELSLYENDADRLEISAGANNLLANKYYKMLSMNDTKEHPAQFLMAGCIKHYSNAIKYDSSVYSALNNLGSFYYSYMNDINKAQNYFERAIAIHPRYPQAIENLGSCYEKKGKEIKALSYYEQAILLNPQQYQSYVKFSNIVIKHGQYKQAIPVIQSALDQFPGNYTILSQLQICYENTSQISLAAENAEKLYGMSPSKKMADKIIELYTQLQNTGKIEYYQTQSRLLSQ